MIDPPKLVQSTATPTAVIHLVIPRSQIQQVMGPAIQEVMAAVAAQGLAPTGPWFTRHFRITADAFDFEVSVPVARPVTPTGRVRPSELPAVSAALTVYRGAYEGLGAAWGEFKGWIAAQGLKPATWIWEVYLTDPAANPDPTSWRTELNQPLEG